MKRRFIFAVLAIACSISVFAAGFDFRTTGTTTTQVFVFKPKDTTAPAVSDPGYGKMFVAGSIGGFSAGNFYISQNGGPWTLLSSFVGSGAVSSVFGRTGAIAALAGDYTAVKITNTPAGNIAAVDVQAALNELDTEKAKTDLTNATNNSVTNALLRDSAALSVIGRSANSTGDPADIAAASDGQVLRRAASVLGFGQLDLASANAVTGALPSGNIATTLSSKTLDNTNTINVKDTLLRIQDDGDVTKQLALQLSGITTGTTRTLTPPNADDTIAGLGTAQTFTQLNRFIKSNDTQVNFGSTSDKGGYLISTADSQGLIGGGVAWNGSNFIAKATSASYINMSAGAVTLATDSGLTAGNSYTPTVRFTLSSTGALTLNAAGGTITERARTTPIGEFVTPSFSAGNYTANGSMTWTVAAGDVVTYEYEITGKKLIVEWYINTTTVGGTLNTILQIAIPGGFTAAKSSRDTFLYTENNALPLITGFTEVAAGGTVIQLRKLDGSNWATTTDLTGVYGAMTFEVQFLLLFIFNPLRRRKNAPSRSNRHRRCDSLGLAA